MRLFSRKNCHEWHDFTPWPWQRFITIDGQPFDGWGMRRMVKGEWQYRNATQEEIDDVAERNAW